MIVWEVLPVNMTLFFDLPENMVKKQLRRFIAWHHVNLRMERHTVSDSFGPTLAQ